MESTGKPGRIQVSESTANLIHLAGKSIWLTKREDVVKAKGKGVLSTFWLSLTTENKTNSSGSEPDLSTSRHETKVDKAPKATPRNKSLVNWMVELLMIHLKKIVSVVTKSF